MAGHALHRPVMLREALELLELKEGGMYIDATTGAGGHAGAMLESLGPRGRLMAMDRDPQALGLARGRLGADPRCTLVHERFSEMATAAREIGIERVDGVLFDFGVSMMQLADPERGFGFNSDERLDMRMDPDDEVSAWDAVNTWPEVELARVIYEFGEERRSRRIAARIVRERQKKTIDTCRALADIVTAALGGRKGRIHPATRTFQGLRIAVNDELGEIHRGLESALELLVPGGRLVAMSYHSLEDRIVKHFFREAAREGRASIVTKKPLVPTDEEVRENPSARSVKLRAAEAL
jgi:16S rRNA (cytosine1402-N4)-methyltransferase